MASKRNNKRSKRTTTKAVQATENLPPPPVPAVEMKPEVDETPWDGEGLTEKQRAFVDALIGPAAGNATQAARMAGYRDDNYNSLRATASENLTKPNVQRYLAAARARKRLSPEWVRDRLGELAGTTMADFMVVRDGKLEIDWGAASLAGAIGQVKEVTEDILPGGDGKDEVIRRRMKLHNPIPALAVMAKVEGLITERIEHSGNVKHTHDVQPAMEKLLATPDMLAHARALRSAGTGTNGHAKSNGNGVNGNGSSNGNGKH